MLRAQDWGGCHPHSIGAAIAAFAYSSLEWDSTNSICRSSADLRGEAGAPEWKKLLADESAISRMTDRLVVAYSEEMGAIPLATRNTALDLVRDLLLAAAQEDGSSE
jgi:hypothetical protein